MYGTQWKVDRSLLKDLPLARAFDTEVATPPDLLPSRTVEPALSRGRDQYVSHLVGVARHGLRIETPEVLAARKTRGGSRPVTVLTFDERVLLRALGMAIDSNLPLDIPSETTFSEMTAGPTEAKSAWVVHADVAAFFTYVDHDLLSTELVALTGAVEIADAATSLLGFLMARRFGLPQGHRSSDVFANIYIDLVERRLIRRGRQVWRYSDDFRLGAASQTDALRAIDELDDELRRVGLSLNDDKTFPQSARAYEEWVAAAEREIAVLADEVESDLTQWDPYKDVTIVPGEEEVWTQAAVKALHNWAQKDPQRQVGPARLANLRVLNTALNILRTYKNPAGLKHCKTILRNEPQLTAHVCSYLSDIARALADPFETEPSEAEQTVEDIIGDARLYLNAWQQLWLIEATRSLVTPGTKIRAWLRPLAREGTSFALQASASSALALLGDMPVDDLLAIYQRLPKASRPEVTAALGSLQARLTRGQRRTVRDDYVSDRIFDHFSPREPPTATYDPALEPF